LKAKKSLGQHFLINEHIAERIAEALPEEKNFIEIGPGRGVLTKYLVKREAHFIPVEKDDNLAVYIANEYPSLEEHIINQDFLKVDLSSLFKGERFSINFVNDMNSSTLKLSGLLLKISCSKSFLSFTMPFKVLRIILRLC